MGANTTRATQVLVSNVITANTGTTAATAVNDDVLLLNRVGTAVSGAVSASIENDVVRVALGTSATAGVVQWSAPIHTRSIRKVTSQLYEVPVQHVVTLSAASVTGTYPAGTVFSIKINFHDTNDLINSGKDASQYFTYKTVAASETPTTIYDGLRAAINGINTNIKQVVATGTTTLILTGLAVTDNALGFPQFRYFDVSLRKGFTYTAGASVVATPGKPGRGIGSQVRLMELSGKYGFNRTQFPADTDTRRGLATGGYYNLVTIEYGTPHLSVHHSTYVAPQTLVIAFFAAMTDAVTPNNGTAVGTVGTKQAAFLTALETLVESAGVFVK